MKTFQIIATNIPNNIKIYTPMTVCMLLQLSKLGYGFQEKAVEKTMEERFGYMFGVTLAQNHASIFVISCAGYIKDI